MKIVIDAYQPAKHITGSDRFAKNILRELQVIDQDNKYIVIVNREHEFVADSIKAPNFKVLPLSVSKRAIWLMLGLPRLLQEHQADVFFSPYNLSGPGRRVCRTIISILDTIPVSQPDLYFGSHSSKLRRAVVSFTMRRPLRFADQFVAISDFTKAMAVKDLGLDANKIEVVYLQADPIFFTPSSTEVKEAVHKKYKLPTSFVFTMGSSEPRKNIATLVKAHQLLPTELRGEFPLVISGARWHGQDIDISADPNISMAGFIDDADLPTVYQLATVFAFPSSYEGFGLPILEAMASKTPVLTTTATSIPEVAGQAAISVEADDPNGMSKALRTLLEQPKERRKLIEAGEAQTLRFSWKVAAERLLKLFSEPDTN